MSDTEEALSLEMNYGFEVNVGGDRVTDSNNITTASSHVRKNAGYAFSQKLNTVFVQRNTDCPFHLKTSVAPPPDTVIRVEVNRRNSTEVVARCRNHSNTLDVFQDYSPLHFVKSTGLEVKHDCNEDGQLYLILPCNPVMGSGVVDIQNLQFACYSSCIKTDQNNKSDIVLSFTLLDTNGLVLGRREFGLHVCRSPGRDIYKHENPRKRKMPSKKEKGNFHSDVYSIKVKKRSHYEILQKINRALMIHDALSHQEQESILKRVRYHSSSHTVSSTSVGTKGDQRITLRRILAPR